MSIRRVVPDIKSKHLAESRMFYVDFLGFELAMDMGFVMTFVSPSNPTAQISVVRDDGVSTLQPNVSVEVADVDQVISVLSNAASRSCIRSPTNHGVFVGSSSSIRMGPFSTF